MHEIEAKVALTTGDFKRLKKFIPTFATKKGSTTKADTYFGKQAFDIRIRSKKGQGTKGVLNLKAKQNKGGIEQNREVQLGLSNANGFAKLLENLGFKKSAKKVKKSEVYAYKNAQIELNTIPGLGHYLEIEIVVESSADSAKAKQNLNTLFKRCGFSPKDYEKKYYLDLLSEKGLI